MTKSVMMRVPTEWEKIIKEQAEKRRESMMEVQRRTLGQMMPQLQDFWQGLDNDGFNIKQKKNR